MVKMNFTTQCMLGNLSHGADLLPTLTNEGFFNGVLQDVDNVGKSVTGYIFGAAPRFDDGTFVETSEIIKVGYADLAGWYIETVSGSRYLISNVNYNPHLDCETTSVEAAMAHRQKYLKLNASYFANKQWSGSA